jgi:hypothetical protein
MRALRVEFRVRMQILLYPMPNKEKQQVREPDSMHAAMPDLHFLRA